MNKNLIGKITIEDVETYRNENHISAYDIIQLIMTNCERIPEPFHKPALVNHNATSSEVKEFLTKLEQYEKDVDERNSKIRDIKELNYSRELVVAEFIKRESGLYSIVPKQYQSKVYDYAYQESHSDGYYGIMQTLSELVEIFE